MRMTMHEFVHGLDCKQASAEITRLESALRRACEFIADYGSCPYDQCYREGMDADCEERCSADVDYAECWRRYFIGEWRNEWN